MDTLYNRIAGRSLERIAALSDGVFAFALTLLVLDIRVPDIAGIHSEVDLAGALLALAPRFAMYLMSFMTLGIFWTGQQTQLNHLAEGDRNLGWLHLVFLAIVAMVPFSTALLAAFITFRLALLVYWANILLLGISLGCSWTFARRAGLVRSDAPRDLSAAIMRRIFVAQALYAIGAALCLFSTYWSIAFILLVQLNYAVAPRLWPLFRI